MDRSLAENVCIYFILLNSNSKINQWITVRFPPVVLKLWITISLLRDFFVDHERPTQTQRLSFVACHTALEVWTLRRCFSIKSLRLFQLQLSLKLYWGLHSLHSLNFLHSLSVNSSQVDNHCFIWCASKSRLSHSFSVDFLITWWSGSFCFVGFR